MFGEKFDSLGNGEDKKKSPKCSYLIEFTVASSNTRTELE